MKKLTITALVSALSVAKAHAFSVGHGGAHPSSHPVIEHVSRLATEHHATLEHLVRHTAPIALMHSHLQSTISTLDIVILGSLAIMSATVLGFIVYNELKPRHRDFGISMR